MTITYSKHAISRCNERQITLSAVNNAIIKGVKYIINNKIKFVLNGICVIAYLSDCKKCFILTVHYN